MCLKSFSVDGTLKLCNIIADIAFLSSPMICKLFCFDGYTIVVKAATLKIVQGLREEPG
jgi:hypothetical protein